MGSTCKSCKINREGSLNLESINTLTNIQKSETCSNKKAKDNIPQAVSLSRFEKMPRKQQTLTPLNYEIDSGNDEQEGWFENQFISFSKTATFVSNSNNQPQKMDQIKENQFINKESLVHIPNNANQIIQKVVSHPNESVSTPQTLPYQLSNKLMQSSTNQQNNLPKQQQKSDKKIERKSSNITQKNNNIQDDCSDIQSVNVDISGELTPRTKGILKNKDKKFSRAKSLYNKEKDDLSQKTSKSKKVKFDPKIGREKNKGLFL